MRSAALAVLIVLFAPVAWAIEPTTVTVESTVPVDAKNDGRERDRVFRAALADAVFEVVRLFASPERLEAEEARLREALDPRAAIYVLTYTVDSGPTRRPTEADPEQEEIVLTLTATVDAAQVRGRLRELGLLRSSRDQPSIALWVHPEAHAFPGARELLATLRRYVADRLRDDGFVVVEPALRPGGALAPASALDLAREVGADLAVDVRVSWTERSLSAGMVGGVAEARARAFRSHDGFEIASARFDAPAYHPSRDEAFVRALEALEDQLADNLLRQLDRNWTALAGDDAPVYLRLANVASFREVEAVQKVLSNVLGAREAHLLTLEPHTAELLFRGSLSPGALLDRLAAVGFEGFRLDPVEVRRDRIELRVARSPAAAPDQAR